MASDLVTAEQYPDLDELQLTTRRGGTVRFLGRLTASAQPCPTCGRPDTVSVARGPQHGLAFDVPHTPYETAPVELELSWCSEHGQAGMRLVAPGGTDYTGP